MACSHTGRIQVVHKSELPFEGDARVAVGDETRTASGGDIVIRRGGAAHSFVNSGKGRICQVDIHPSPRFETEWLS